MVAAGHRCIILGAALALLACDGSVEHPPGARLLIPGDAALVGLGVWACSAGEGPAASRSRWCAFHRAAEPGDKRHELWVFDLDRALAEPELRCDGTSDACLRLTEDLFTGTRFGSPSHPEAHRFDGDTLLFLANERVLPMPPDHYEGLVWAWRPGWKRARPLTTDRGVLCRGHARSAGVYCVDLVDERIPLFDLRAGLVTEGGVEPLPAVDRIAAVRRGDVVWSADFTPAGTELLYSSWRDGDAAQALRTVPLAEVGRAAPRTVATDGRRWSLAPGGRTVYFMRGGRSEGPGALWAADFPGGENAAELAQGVFSFLPLRRGAEGDGGVAFMTEMRGLEGVLNLARDRRQPAAVTVIARDVHFWYAAQDGSFAYILQVDRRGERGLIANLEAGTTCQLGSHPEARAYTPSVLDNLGVVAWSEPHPDGAGGGAVWVARPGDCGGTRLLGVDLEGLAPFGPRGLLFTRPADEHRLALLHVPEVRDDAPVDAHARTVLDDVERDGMAVVSGRRPAVLARARPNGTLPAGIHVYEPR